MRTKGDAPDHAENGKGTNHHLPNSAPYGWRILQSPFLHRKVTNDAELIVARKSAKGFEPLRKYSVADSPTWAHPVILNRGVLIKDATTLALWGAE